MKIYIDNHKNLRNITKISRVNLHIKINKSLKHDIKFISRKESLAEYTIKTEIIPLLFRYGHEYEHEHKNRTKLFIRKFKVYIKQC